MGDDFYGREPEIAKAKEFLANNNLMLAAPRRVGKTSVARRIQSEMSHLGWNTVFMDLEGIGSISEFFKELNAILYSLPEVSASSKVKNLLSSFAERLEVSIPLIGTEISFSSILSDSFSQLEGILTSYQNQTLIIFDELTVFLQTLAGANNETIEDAHLFLNKFRAIRLATSSCCRWMVCSSVGVRNFTNTHSLSDTINDFMDFPLGAYEDHEAQGLIYALCSATNRMVNGEVCEHIMQRIGWNIPYFIQLLVSDLPTGEISKPMVDEAYCRLIETSAFDTLIERLRREYGDNKRIAEGILTYLCVKTTPTSREQIFNFVSGKILNLETDQLGFVLKALVVDGYLHKSHDGYVFRSPLLRDYWKSTFVD